MWAVDNWQRKLVVPQGKLRQALMHGAHDALVSGHLGFNKAYECLRQGVTWPEMYSDLKAIGMDGLSVSDGRTLPI
jgi:Integrase zinc binding domain